MEEVKTNENQVALVKIINETVYKVRVHFNDKATETMEDKITKLIIQEMRDVNLDFRA